MTTTRGLALVVVLTSFSASAQMLNDQGPPQHRVVHRNTFALRVNPLGLLYEGRFMYRFRLYQSDSVALRDNFISLGLTPIMSPAFMRVGPYIEIAPASFLTLWASFTFVQYFGTFNLMQSFTDASSRFSDAEITSRGTLPAGDPQRAYLGNGTELTLGADLQFKVKSFVLRSRNRLVRPDMKLRAGDTVFYDQFYDVLAPNKGLYFTTDADVLYAIPGISLMAGARYTGTVPFYDTTQNPNGVNNNLHRVGPFLAYTFFSRDGAAFNSPTVFLLIQWWLQHRYRTGTEVTQALPLIGAGFQFTGDLIPIK